MRSALPWLALGAVCYAAAGWSAAGRNAERSPVSALRKVTRPLTLPFAWRALDDAERSPDPSAGDQRARVVMELLPEWVDGHLLYATQLALRPAPSDDVAVAQLAAALDWLQGAATGVGPREPEMWSSMAILVQIAGRDREDAVESAFGQTPESLAVEFRRRAEALAPSPIRTEDRIFAETQLIRAALRVGEPERARGAIRAVLPQLETVRDRALATEWSQALRDLDFYLENRRQEDREKALAHPQWADLAPLLPSPQ